MSSDGECVKVVVRCRPMNSKEKDMGSVKIVKIDRKNLSVTLNRGAGPPPPNEEPKTFTYDNVYDDDSEQATVYAETAFPLVKAVMEGYNGTMFAYGQTGCGKSFTMSGVFDNPELRGIIPRTFDQIFTAIANEPDSNVQYLVAVSYLEIYNEEVRDLLSHNPKQRLDVKEDPEKGVFIRGLSCPEVRNVQQILHLMAQGNKVRSTGATAMNADSSRSHSLFTVKIETSTTMNDEQHIKAGKLNLVDLAGSERQSKTQATGDRLKEAQKINLSLSALGNVISALVVASQGKDVHIPYRDSKLTRLLQDSLGGNTKTIMIAAISPADYNYDETLSTLRYANRAKNIKNKPKINEDPKDAMLREFQDEIQRLKKMLMEKGIDADSKPKKKKKKKMNKDGVMEASSEEEEEEESDDDEADSGAPRVKKARKKKVRTGGDGDDEDEEIEDDPSLMTSQEREQWLEEKRAMQEEFERLRDEKQKHEAMATAIREQIEREAQERDRLKREKEQLEAEMKQHKDNAALAAQHAALEAERVEREAIMEQMKRELESEKEEHVKKAAELESELKQRKELEDAQASLSSQAQSDKKHLKAKLKKLEKKVLKGGEKVAVLESEVEAKARLAAEEANKRRELEAKERDEKLKNEEKNLWLEENYESVKDEVIGKTKKLKKIKKKYFQLQSEMTDQAQEFENQREEYLTNIKDASREAQLYRQILLQLLTRSDFDKITGAAVWQDEREEWLLPKMDFPVFFPTIKLNVSNKGNSLPVNNKSALNKTTKFSEEKTADAGWKRSVVASIDRDEFAPSRSPRERTPTSHQTTSETLPPELQHQHLMNMLEQPIERANFQPGRAPPSQAQQLDIEATDAKVQRRAAFNVAQPSSSSPSPPPASLVDAPKRPAFAPAAPPQAAATSSALTGLMSSVPARPAFAPSQPLKPSEPPIAATIDVPKRANFEPSTSPRAPLTSDPTASILHSALPSRPAFQPAQINITQPSIPTPNITRPAFQPAQI